GRGDSRTARVSDDGHVGLAVASTGGGVGSAALRKKELSEDQEGGAEDEAKRIFYVAMTRAEEHLILSGATDTEKWPEERTLGPPIDWAWRAVAPGAAGVLERGPVGEADGVRVALCTPGSLDEVLPPADRAPEA